MPGLTSPVTRASPSSATTSPSRISRSRRRLRNCRTPHCWRSNGEGRERPISTSSRILPSLKAGQMAPNQESENLRIKNRRISESKNGGSPALKSEKLRIPNKRFEKDTEEEIPEETHSHKNDRANGGVGVGSKFTLEECRRYAAHLHATGQGITNPGGYATTIYRSGEVDPLIESFLQPPAPAPAQTDLSACPDCHGTGY